MRKRYMVCICLPLLLLFALKGLSGSKAAVDAALLTVEEGQSVLVGGTVYRQDFQGNRQSIYLNNISFYSKPEKTVFHEADFLPKTSEKQKFKIKVYLKTADEVKLGEYVLLQGETVFFRPASNPGEFDEAEFYSAQKIGMLLKGAVVKKRDGKSWPLRNAMERIRRSLETLLRKTADEKNAGILCAMVLGDKSSVDTEIKGLYRDAGLIHLLAISGLHITMLGMGLYHLLRRGGLPLHFAAVLCATMMLAYVFMTGMAYSAVRAWIMFAVYLLAKVTGRTYDLPTALAVAAVMILYGTSGAVTQAGFLMSFGAVSGVILGGSFKSRVLKKHGLGISFGIQIMTLPLTAYFYYKMPLYGVIINFLILPLMPFVMGCGIAGMAAGLLLPAAGRLAMLPACRLISIINLAAEKVQMLPWATVVTGKPALSDILWYYVLIFLVFFLLDRKWGENRKIDLIKLLFAIILLSGISGKAGTEKFQMTFLDVGQGDGCCIENGKKSVWMIDGGSSTKTGLAEYTLEPFLYSEGKNRVDGWLISHYDLDHLSGLLEILEGYQRDFTGRNSGGITIGQIFLPDIRTDSEVKKQICVLAEKAGIPVFYVSDGDVFGDGAMTLRILAPQKGRTYLSENASSMVVKAEYQDFSALLTGDLEKDGEERLLSLHSSLKVDVLKVAHHGSEYSTSEKFLQCTEAKAAVISCGKNNRYGHPAQELLQRLFRRGCHVTRTDEQGAVILQADKKTWNMQAYQEMGE